MPRQFGPKEIEATITNRRPSHLAEPAVEATSGEQTSCNTLWLFALAKGAKLQSLLFCLPLWKEKGEDEVDREENRRNGSSHIGGFLRHGISGDHR